MLKGKFFVNTWGYSMTINDFVIVLSETPKTVMVQKVKNRVVSGDAGYSGGEVPTTVRVGKPFRLQKRPNYFRGQFALRGSDKSDPDSGRDPATWYPWDGEPERFNYMD